MAKILLLGSGELGKEFVIAAQRIGQHIIAVDSYENAPAMQVANQFEVINMLDGNALDTIVAKHKPDYIVPEIEAIRTERFYDYEKQGFTVVPSAKAANFTGEIVWDINKPDGTPKKQLNISKFSNLGWNASIELDEGIKKTISSFKKENPMI